VRPQILLDEDHAGSPRLRGQAEFGQLPGSKSSLFRGGDHSATPNGGGALGDAEREAGMAKMSDLYNQTGRELYMGAGGREHD
jgi:hypothetical protein